MNISSRGGLAALCVLLATVGCASRSAGRNPNMASDASMEKRADALEERNQQLREELRRKEAEVEQSFAAVTRAEDAAQLGSLGCAGATPSASPARGLPRSGAVHAKLALQRQSYRVTTSFTPARTVGTWKVSQGTCQVASP
ncbi:hypothetical protein KRR26_10655 [Corallococcus sp. M34]|uniref:hypothetical protein n=1 Tax=Citreicoccus inhibens TaxID=2849499 RepID=UPI001C2339CE|nr:hypothetical protein [Citreicoccus inhibens]MBU8896068.1 hypothetical protein [Citreicoccus inhibens]